MSVEVARIYGGPDGAPAYRVLVDRLWPRGVAKADAALDEWAHDVAPSTDLRRWYGHDPARFDEFAARYRAELRHPPGAEVVARLRGRARTGRVVLVTATREVDHSAAFVLSEVLRSSSPSTR